MPGRGGGVWRADESKSMPRPGPICVRGTRAPDNVGDADRIVRPLPSEQVRVHPWCGHNRRERQMEGVCYFPLRERQGSERQVRKRPVVICARVGLRRSTRVGLVDIGVAIGVREVYEALSGSVVVNEGHG